MERKLYATRAKEIAKERKTFMKNFLKTLEEELSSNESNKNGSLRTALKSIVF